MGLLRVWVTLAAVWLTNKRWSKLLATIFVAPRQKSSRMSIASSGLT